MKRLLRNKANFDILERLLSELLKEDIKIKQILDSESNKVTNDDKHNRVDILVENSNYFDLGQGKDYVYHGTNVKI